VAALTGFSYKKILGVLPEQRSSHNKKVTYHKVGFHFTRQLTEGCFAVLETKF